MKIHYYMQFFPGSNAPGSLQPMALARFLAERGHEVSVVSTDYNLDTGLPEDPVEYISPGGGFAQRAPAPFSTRGPGESATAFDNVCIFYVYCKA